MIREILLLGNPELYQVSREVERDELNEIPAIVKDLHDTMVEYRRVHGAGRAIAAPQIGVFRRILYMNTGDQSMSFLNPSLEFPDEETMEVMDDCMSFPGLLVKVLRRRRCVIHYRDLDWNLCRMEFSDDLSELLQHEYDHLDGILATMRAVDSRSFFLRTK